MTSAAVLHTSNRFWPKQMLIFHNNGCVRRGCRRQIEKSPLAQIEMSLSTILDGEHWADDGD